MSTTRPPGYDDRFVVPIEASRRGAHRARVTPLIAALPVVAVVSVVIGVVALAYALLGSGGGGDNAGGPTSPAVVTTGGAGRTTGPTGKATTSPSASTGPSRSPSPSSSPSATGKVDHAAAITVLNGTGRRGLAKTVATTLTRKGWKDATPSFKAAPGGGATTVYYATSDQKATAEAVVADLGVGVTKKSATIAGTGLVVSLGTDYP